MIDLTTRYAQDVVDGVYIVGELVFKACERHLRDLDRIGNDDFPYIFDIKKANRIFDFYSYLKHIKGEYAGKPIELVPFQHFILGSIYGWVHKDTGLRKYRKVYIEVGRKNAKSTLTSGIALYELGFNGEEGAEIYATATKRDQAKIVFDASRLMAMGSKDIAKRLHITRDKIEHPKSNSFFVPLSNDTKSADGSNPHVSVVDEFHAHKTSEMYDVMVSGMGQRANPLLWIITTAGFTIGGACHKESEYCSKIVRGIVDNEEYFVYIARLDKDDDISEKRNWYKANPLLEYTSYMMKYLEGEHKMALEQPEKMRNFLTKNLNRWVLYKENGYMDMEKFELATVEEMPNLKGKPCYIGVDLSSKIDLTSIGCVFILDDNKYFVMQHSFIPQNIILEKERQDKVQYSLWIKQGWMSATEGDVVDYNYIENYIEELDKKYDIIEICFDPWNATQFANNMDDKGFQLLEIRQGYKTLSEPLKNFREQVYKGNVTHLDDPLLKWTTSNAVVKQDANENITLAKDKSFNRIDPIVAIINGYTRAMVNEKPLDLDKEVENFLDNDYW